MTDNQIIIAVYGLVNRDGDASFYARVGYNGITSITRRVENLGDYDIVWFDAFKGEHIFASFNARAVADIYYADEVTK
jgi:hypothetical protein